MLEDQGCNGVEHRVDLHLHEQVNMVGHRGEGKEWAEWEVYDYLTVYATKEFDHDPAVFIGRRGLAGAKLTPSEVRQLAHDLLLVASEIEGKV